MDRSILNQPVSEVMSAPVRTVDYKLSTSEAARTLLRNEIGSLVVENDGIEGIVTKSDLVKAIAAERTVDGETVGQLMTETVLTVGPEESIEIACERMRANGIKKLPVVEDGQPIGIVTTTDITHSLVPNLNDVISSFQ
jgi:CBS domain-containing protein